MDAIFRTCTREDFVATDAAVEDDTAAVAALAAAAAVSKAAAVGNIAAAAGRTSAAPAAGRGRAGSGDAAGVGRAAAAGAVGRRRHRSDAQVPSVLWKEKFEGQILSITYAVLKLISRLSAVLCQKFEILNALNFLVPEIL